MNKHTKDNNSASKHEKEERSFTIDLPDVDYIPGQSAAAPAAMGAVGSDITIASGDEEGDGLFDDGEEITDSGDAFDDNDEMLTPVQQEALEQTGTEEDRDLRAAEVDSTDDDGTPLNEKNEEDDLDIPGASLDDEDEQIGEEDEENNEYSTPN